MATTTTFGVGLGAAALAGAASLGLAGLAVAAFHRGRGRRNKGHRGHGYGHGHGHGGGHGHGHGYGYHGRKRRSVEEEEATRERILELVREEDVTDCGKRLVCEIGGNDEGELSVEELAILSLVGPVFKPGEGILPGQASTIYRIARTAGSLQANCTDLYPKCPIEGNTLVESVMAYIP